jgi:hypothetical protein
MKKLALILTLMRIAHLRLAWSLQGLSRSNLDNSGQSSFRIAIFIAGAILHFQINKIHRNPISLLVYPTFFPIGPRKSPMKKSWLASREVPAENGALPLLGEVPVSHVPSSTRKAAQTRTAGSTDWFYGGFLYKMGPHSWLVCNEKTIYKWMIWGYIPLF